MYVAFAKDDVGSVLRLGFNEDDELQIKWTIESDFIPHFIGKSKFYGTKNETAIATEIEKNSGTIDQQIEFIGFTNITDEAIADDSTAYCGTRNTEQGQSAAIIFQTP